MKCLSRPHCLLHPPPPSSLPPLLFTACPRDEALFPPLRSMNSNLPIASVLKYRALDCKSRTGPREGNSTQSLCGGSLLPSLCKTSKHKHHCFAFLFQSSFMLLKYERKQQLLKLKYSRRKAKISQNATHKNPVNIYVSIFRNYT